MMNNEKLKLLPLGESSFHSLRQWNQIYVDKTALIYKIASFPAKCFIARPRRFGKSLLISTFESLFKEGIQDFQGLEIEKLWKDNRKYKVVRLDFSEIKPSSGIEKFRDDLRDRLIDNFSLVGFSYDKDGTSIFSQLSRWMKTIPANSLVLLIDEYDSPLTYCLGNKKLYNDVRSALSDFYSILKSNDLILRFLFITGITKFSKTSIFSELNNLSDLTLDPQFGSLLGYTHEEIKKYFDGYLERACNILSMDKEELLKELTLRYDGFCFEETASQKVFSPWSVLNFFANPSRGLKDYWFESGGKPTVITQYFKSHSLLDPEEYGKQKSISLFKLSSSSDVEELTDIGLLTQTGYLTIKKVEGQTAYVGYPNEEVRTAMAMLYSDLLLSDKTTEEVGAGNIAARLSEENAEAIVLLLNRLFSSIDYQRYPVKDEASLRAFVQVFFAGAGLKPRIENHSARGRSDLEVRAGKRYWVFEFKVASIEAEEEVKLQEGLQQMISRCYGEQEDRCKLMRIVLVYSLKRRKFVRWQEVKC